MPRLKPAKEEISELSREYLVARNHALQLKNRREEMLSARARGELIEKRLVRLQASFLLTAMTRQAMALPQALCDKLAGIADPLEVKAILEEAVRGFLTEVQDLPNRIDAKEWEKFLFAEQGSGDGAPAESEEKPAKVKTPRRKG